MRQACGRPYPPNLLVPYQRHTLSSFDLNFIEIFVLNYRVLKFGQSKILRHFFVLVLLFRDFDILLIL